MFYKSFLFIRSLIFNIYIVFVLILYGLVGSPLILLKSRKILYFSKLWADAMIFGAKIICGISYKIEGKMPLKPCIIASKHQSTFECCVFLKLFPGSCFILKKELLKIPIFGSYLRALDMIAIDRDNGREAIKIMNSEVGKRIKDERFVVIFPEGTRKEFGEKADCKSGIVFLHKANIGQIWPVWVNSGKFWGKKSFIKYPGEVTVKFFDPIDENENSKEITKKLNEIFDM